MLILDALQTLGLEEKEAKVYAALLELRQSTVLPISEKSGVKRATTYVVLDRLHQQGLVSASKYRGVVEYRTQGLEPLKAQLAKQNRLVSAYGTSMRQLYDARPQKLRLRVYTSLQAIKVLLEKSIREKSSCYILGSERVWQEQVGAYWDFFLKRMREQGCRVVCKDSPLPTQLLIWHDKVAFISFSPAIQAVAFRNTAAQKTYLNLWKNY